MSRIGLLNHLYLFVAPEMSVDIRAFTRLTYDLYTFL